MTTYPASSYGLLQEVERRGREIKKLKIQCDSLREEIKRMAKQLGDEPRYEAQHRGFGKWCLFDRETGEHIQPTGDWMKQAEAKVCAENMNSAIINKRAEGEAC